MMSASKTLSPTADVETLREIFSGWDKEKLIQYALSVTQAVSDRENGKKETVESSRQYNPLLRSMVLVEQIGESLSSTLDMNEVLTRLLRLVNEALDVEDGSILLTQEPSKDLIFQTSLGSISQKIKPFRVPRGHGIAGEVAQTGVPIRVDNAQKDSRHFKQIDQDTGFLTRSILCVPLVTRNKIIGVLEVFNKRSGPFTMADEALLSSIANYAAISIENARLHENVIAERDRVLQVQEEASNKLQRDLHDGPTQLVAAMQMSIEFCKMALERDMSKIGPELDNMQALAERATHQMRTLLFELRPLELETKGLAAALSTFVERRQKSEKAQLHLEIQSDAPDSELTRLKSKYERALFAIVQEAANNSLKYAKAKNVYIKIQQAVNEFQLTVLDDGLGFDLKSVTHNYEDRGSYGMINQQERAEILGTELQMRSALGAGTETSITFNLTSELKRDAEA